MDVAVNEALAAQLDTTNKYLIKIKSRRDAMNDRTDYVPTLEVLNGLAVAVSTAQIPTKSFIHHSPGTNPRFTVQAGSSVGQALEGAVAFLQDSEVMPGNINSLSAYNRGLTDEALTLVKRLYFAVLVSIRKNAEQDLMQIQDGGGDLSHFLTMARELSRMAQGKSTL